MVLAILLVACQPSVLGAKDLKPAKQPATPKTWILPVLRCGINNQKMDLRQLAAMAKVLDAGLILTGVYQHYTDTEAEEQARKKLDAGKIKANQLCFPPKFYGFMDFDRLFDRKPFEDFVPVMSLDELRQTGWDGTAQVLVHGSDWELDMWTFEITMKGIQGQLAQGAPVISIKPSYMHCDPKQISKVKKLIQPYRVVAMYLWGVGDMLFPNYHDLYKSQLPEDACQRTTLMAEKLMEPSVWVKGMADKFKAQYFNNEDYLAAHIRPYPDGCLDLWKAKTLNTTALEEQCEQRLRTLHKDVPTKIAKQLAKTKLRNLFIMSHPRIRHSINSLLKQVNLTGVTVAHLDMPTLRKLAGCINHSTSFLSTVEEVIAAQAHSFIGTATSSITRSIILMRSIEQAKTVSWFEHDEPMLGSGRRLQSLPSQPSQWE